METVSIATNTVHEFRILEGQSSTHIFTLLQMKTIGQKHLRHTNMPQRLDRFVFQKLKMVNNKIYVI